MSIAAEQWTNRPFLVGERVVACTAHWIWTAIGPLSECTVIELSTSSWVKVRRNYKLFSLIPCRSTRWVHCWELTHIDTSAQEIATLEKMAK